MRELYELCGKDRDIRFSPYVWAVRMALKHKGLDFTAFPVQFLEKDSFAPSGSKAVPVLKEGDIWVADSLVIAKYLEKHHPERALFGGAIAQAQAGLLQALTIRTVFAGLFPMVAVDVHACLDEASAAYFRETREGRLGTSLEKAAAGREDRLAALLAGFEPFRQNLTDQTFLGGESPAWADYFLFGGFQWVRTVSALEVLPDQKDSLYQWRERMRDLFDGEARKAKSIYA